MKVNNQHDTRNRLNKKNNNSAADELMNQVAQEKAPIREQEEETSSKGESGRRAPEGQESKSSDHPRHCCCCDNLSPHRHYTRMCIPSFIPFFWLSSSKYPGELLPCSCKKKKFLSMFLFF
jgi:hypothetical protein